jgi:hypothetical protein
VRLLTGPLTIILLPEAADDGILQTIDLACPFTPGRSKNPQDSIFLIFPLAFPEVKKGQLGFRLARMPLTRFTGGLTGNET